MLDLCEKSTAAWTAKLPDDVREVIDAGDAPLAEGAAAFAAILARAQTEGGEFGAIEVARQVPDMVREHADGAKAIGRAGRLRLVAWVTARGGDNPGPILKRIVGEARSGDDEDGSGSSDPVGILFLEDIRAIAESVVGPRMAHRIVDGETVELAVEAAATLESDMVFRQGGM